ncbi:MAG TPA: serine hydrolase [Tepiditoga sp.]|nr:serine hydrolase [Tepiditoga sp.]
MNKNILSEAIESVKKQNLNVLNIIVRQNGEKIAEHNFVKPEPRLLYSISKTFTSMAVGIASYGGYFNLNDHLTDFFDIPEKYMSDNLKKITVHDLLRMGSGHEKCPVENADWSKGQKWDIEELFFKEPVLYTPGTHFTYDNSSSYMLSRIISITTKTNLDDFLNEKVFRHTGIEKPLWEKSPTGYPQGFSGIHLTAEDVSKFSQLILNKGVWKNKSLIPSEYIEKATSLQIKTDDFTPFFATADHQSGYGYHLWMNSYKNSYRLDGLFGQYSVIMPDKNAVVTYVSNEPKNMTGVLELTWNTIAEKL